MWQVFQLVFLIGVNTTQFTSHAIPDHGVQLTNGVYTNGQFITVCITVVIIVQIYHHYSG